MQWYYRWKLKRIQKEIRALKESTNYRLVEDYTANSRLRTLSRLAAQLEERLVRSSSAPSPQH